MGSNAYNESNACTLLCQLCYSSLNYFSARITDILQFLKNILRTQERRALTNLRVKKHRGNPFINDMINTGKHPVVGKICLIKNLMIYTRTDLQKLAVSHKAAVFHLFVFYFVNGRPSLAYLVGI